MSMAVAAANDSGTLGRIHTGELDTTHGAVLYLEDITVSFDGFRALNQLSLSIDVGELRCVIGPNGAGKTTMMDVITGKTRPDAGSAFFGQTIDLTTMTEAEIAHAGIGRKFQKPTIFEYLSVFENLELAMKADKRVRSSLFSRISSAQSDRIAETLEQAGHPALVLAAAGLFGVPVYWEAVFVGAILTLAIAMSHLFRRIVLRAVNRA